MIDKKKLINPDKVYRPDVRWWLAEGLHTDETLNHDLDLLDKAGFGAVEFLAMDEPGADSSIYGWGSEEWVHDSDLMFRETTKRGMGVSATCGTNWSNCNLTTITPDDKAAAKELDFVVEELSAGQKRVGEIKKCKLFMPGVTKQEFVAVVAIRDLGTEDGEHYLDKDSAIVLNDQIAHETLAFTAPDDGNYLLFYFWIHGTGQTAKPSVSVSYTVNYMDHYGIDAFIEYWDSQVITPELRETLKKNGRAMMYMDSLELSTFSNGGQLWGYHFIEEFKNRRGYDVTPYLPFVVKKSGMMQVVFKYHYHMTDKNFEEKFYNDLYQTMTDMYMENMMKPMQEWCHKNHMELRSEISYGLPFEISQPGKYVDDVETESLEFCSQIEPYRGLAGCAHVYDKVFSSETGATTMNYMMPLDFYTQIIYTQFAAGVTKTVLHGYSSIAGSEDSTYWPGHEGMWPVFSERFGVRQPAWQHYKDWTGMLARYQMLLRTGKPRMDLAILRFDYYFNNLYFGDSMNEKEFYETQLMRGHEGVYWKDMSLQDVGYTWDYFAPQILEEQFVGTANGNLLPEGPAYQAVILYQQALPVEAAEKLLSLAKKGLRIVFVNGCTETVRPGHIDVTHKKAACMTPFNDGRDSELSKIIDEIKLLPTTVEVEKQSETVEALKKLGIHPRTEFTEPNRNILTLMKETNDEVIFYAYNMLYTETEPFSFRTSIASDGVPYRIDCWNAEIQELGSYERKDGRTIIATSLAPGEACLYVIKKNEVHKHVVSTPANTNVVVKQDKLWLQAFASGDYEIVSECIGSDTIHTIVPEAQTLTEWELQVEDWNEGEKVELTEDRGKGYVTKEVYYKTKKTMIPAGKVNLVPWKDIPAIGPEVSGVGYYTTSVKTPDNWNENMGAILKIKSANHNTVAVYVNEQKAGAIDIDTLALDITKFLHRGENKICIEVSSTLNNRLLARKYFDMVGELSRHVAAEANNATSVGDSDETDDNPPGLHFDVSSTVHNYGLEGSVRILYYTITPL